MKKTLLIAAAALISASAFAQTVTSANIVGYVKVETVSGFKIVSQQFEGGDATPTGLFGDTLPLGSKIYQFDPTSGYSVSEYTTIFLAGDAWDTALDLSSGSFWVESSSINTNTFSGDVGMADSVTNNIVPGFSMQVYPYPVTVAISDLDITPTLGDKIYKFNPGSGYSVSEYTTIFLAGDAWDTELTFEVGDGFWYENAAATTNVWIEAKPF